MIRTLLFLFCMSSLFAAPSCPTHFKYDDLKSLAPLSSTYTINEASLEKWDGLIQEYLDENKIKYRARFFAYLYTATRDAVFLTYQEKHHFEGSIDPLVLQICQLFYPEFPKPDNFESDDYSDALATLIATKYQLRYQVEQKEMDKVKGPLQATKMFFWLLKEPIYPPPPLQLQSERGVQKQIDTLKKACKKFTDEDERQALHWAGMLYPGSGDWRLIALDYMEEKEVIFAKEVLVRSHLMMALVDGIIDSMISKYHYNFPRPPLQDPTLIPSVPLPKTPSYPSGHAVEAAVANVILSFYFPSDSPKWTKLAKEAARSRICAKVHYPLDRKAGLNLGQKIGTLFLEKTEHEPIPFKEGSLGPE